LHSPLVRVLPGSAQVLEIPTIGQHFEDQLGCFNIWAANLDALKEGAESLDHPLTETTKGGRQRDGLRRGLAHLNSFSRQCTFPQGIAQTNAHSLQ
jgi:hypothetical protein